MNEARKVDFLRRRLSFALGIERKNLGVPIHLPSPLIFAITFYDTSPEYVRNELSKLTLRGV